MQIVPKVQIKFQSMLWYLVGCQYLNISKAYMLYTGSNLKGWKFFQFRGPQLNVSKSISAHLPHTFPTQKFSSLKFSVHCCTLHCSMLIHHWPARAYMIALHLEGMFTSRQGVTLTWIALQCNRAVKKCRNAELQQEEQQVLLWSISCYCRLHPHPHLTNQHPWVKCVGYPQAETFNP